MVINVGQANAYVTVDSEQDGIFALYDDLESSVAEDAKLSKFKDFDLSLSIQIPSGLHITTNGYKNYPVVPHAVDSKVRGPPVNWKIGINLTPKSRLI